MTYESQQGSTYDPASGTPTREVYSVGVRVLFVAYARREVDGVMVLATDRRALIAARELGAVEPRPADRLRRADGSVWQVLTSEVDPALSLWTLQVRRP